MSSFHYHLGTFTKEQYDILDVSLRDANDPTYVAREVSQTDDILHSPTRGIFWLSEEEVTELETKPEIDFIHKDPDRNIDEYPVPDSDDLHCAIEDRYRYNEGVKHHNYFASAADFPANPTSDDLRRCGYQLLRTTKKNGTKTKFGASGIWNTYNSVPNENVDYSGDGSDVDVICMDNGTWIGHIEFINNRPSNESPTGYVGGNVLPGDGICDCLDVVCDGPYYIDPDWFNASPGSRLTTRWDGTTVPTDTEARAWWTNSANRSAQFASAGTVAIPSYYNRLNAHGDYNSTPSNGTHGTQCGSQIFGRTHGWAFNANKWIIDGYSSYGLGLTRVWDVQKIFHQNKPVNTKYGTKDPTISSNSWGYRATPPDIGYANHRGTQISYINEASEPLFMRYIGKDGDTGRMKSEFVDGSLTTSAKEMVDSGVIFICAAGNSSQKQTQSDHPDYGNFFHTSSSGKIDDGSTFTQFGYYVYPTINRPGFPQHAGKSTINTVAYNINTSAAGSGAYTLTGTDRGGSVSGSNPAVDIKTGDTVNFNMNASGHPLYIKTQAGTGTGNQVNNPSASGQGSSSSGTVSWTPKWPGTYYYQCGFHGAMVGTITVTQGQVQYPGINIGALDDFYASGNLERKVNYSDMGNAIDCFAPADGSLAATPGTYGTDIPRYDNTYTSKANNTTWSDGTTGTSSSSRDVRFGGTSSACPIAAGLIATIVQYNRNWTWQDVKTWLGSLQNKTAAEFYIGTEESGPNDAGWADRSKIQGSIPRVIYQGGTYSHTTKETTTKDLSMGSGIGLSGNWNIQRD